MKNIRHANSQYTRHLISSPLILKAYNYRMGGVDKHDRLEGQIPIQLTSKRGYLRVFFHLLDTALVKAWIMFRTTIQARGEWNEAANRRYTLAWFKESVIFVEHFADVINLEIPEWIIRPYSCDLQQVSIALQT